MNCSGLVQSGVGGGENVYDITHLQEDVQLVDVVAQSFGSHGLPVGREEKLEFVILTDVMI